MTLHRELQIAALNDRATDERIAYYCRAIKATSINNNGAARYFTRKAQQWERIRVTTSLRLRKFA